MLELFDCESYEEFLEHTGGIFSGVMYEGDHVRVREELERQMSLDDVGSKDYVRYRIRVRGGSLRSVIEVGHLIEVEGDRKLFYELLVPVADDV
jgi:hypothetical protein